jgi:hypothetical protein
MFTLSFFSLFLSLSLSLSLSQSRRVSCVFGSELPVRRTARSAATRLGNSERTDDVETSHMTLGKRRKDEDRNAASSSAEAVPNRGTLNTNNGEELPGNVQVSAACQQRSFFELARSEYFMPHETVD